MRDLDYLLVGGGLQSGLVALAVLDRRPDARIAILERGPRLGGNHTWCFHAGDLPGGHRGFVAPLIEHRWPGYDVIFPDHRRTVASPYAGTSGVRLAEVVERRVRAARGEILTDTRAARVGAREVALEGGQRLVARAVVDARGPERVAEHGHAGYQKFVGLEVELSRPHGVPRPVLMDATVDQQDGFRFVYVLPFDAHRVLIEDTRFSDSPALDDDALAAGVHAWASAAGLDVARVLRRERGVLPMPWRAADPAPPFAPLTAGYAGGWFHPATGYSFPVAARLAAAIAAVAPEHIPEVAAALAVHQRRQARFARLLNRLLFRWFAPEDRWRVLSRFYRLPEATIRRFYALDTTPADRARILLGRPPRGLSLRARFAA